MNPGEDTEYIEGPAMRATKYDESKPMYSFLPAEALEGAAKVFMYGAKKYDAHNWRGGMKWLRMWDAVQRHLWAWKEGEELDPESGLPHLDHAMCGLMMLRTHIAREYGEDNRFKELIDGKAQTTVVPGQPVQRSQRCDPRGPFQAGS